MDVDLSTVITGTEVYDSEGSKLGVVEEVGTEYLIVERGLLSTRQIYVPASIIARVTTDRIHLSVPKDRVTAGDQDQPM